MYTCIVRSCKFVFYTGIAGIKIFSCVLYGNKNLYIQILTFDIIES